jgi:hypothetical protein
LLPLAACIADVADAQISANLRKALGSNAKDVVDVTGELLLHAHKRCPVGASNIIR